MPHSEQQPEMAPPCLPSEDPRPIEPLHAHVQRARRLLRELDTLTFDHVQEEVDEVPGAQLNRQQIPELLKLINATSSLLPNLVCCEHTETMAKTDEKELKSDPFGEFLDGVTATCGRSQSSPRQARSLAYICRLICRDLSRQADHLKHTWGRAPHLELAQEWARVRQNAVRSIRTVLNLLPDSDMPTVTHA